VHHPAAHDPRVGRDDRYQADKSDSAGQVCFRVARIRAEQSGNTASRKGKGDQYDQIQLVGYDPRLLISQELPHLHLAMMDASGRGGNF